MQFVSRFDTVFSLRYAVRVLERYGQLWRHVALGFKFFAVLSGTAALAAVTSQHVPLAWALGLVFAALAAAEVVLDPAARAAAALGQRRDYARLLARSTGPSESGTLSDEALHAQYAALVADDVLVVPEVIKHMAYNDVVREQGLDLAGCYPPPQWMWRALAR